jgi:hypothetical protein
MHLNLFDAQHGNEGLCCKTINTRVSWLTAKLYHYSMPCQQTSNMLQICQPHTAHTSAQLYYWLAVVTQTCTLFEDSMPHLAKIQC